MKSVYGMMAVLVVCGVILAQGTATSAEPARIAKKESVKVVKGVIVSTNPVTSTIIIKSWQAEDALVINEKTGITAGNEKAIKFADLKADDRVTAFYKFEQGNKVALQIIVKAAMPVATVPDSRSIK